jgi:hypothetical protein
MMTCETSENPRRGFSLLPVLVILGVVVGGLGAILMSSGDDLRQSSQARTKEVMASAMEFGLNQAVEQIQRMDPETLIAGLTTGAGRWNIFENWQGAESFVCPGLGACIGTNRDFVYPPQFAAAERARQGDPELQVRVGLNLGQRTRAPAGEDVSSSYGYILEVQIAVSRAGSASDATERAIYGVRLPHTYSHAN